MYRPALLFLFALALLTLGFGGVSPLAQLVLGVAGGAFGVWATQGRWVLLPAQRLGIFAAMGGLGLLMFWVMASVLPWAAYFNAALMHPFWVTLNDLNLAPLWPTPSLTPGQTLQNLALLLGLGGMGMALARLSTAEPVAALLRKGVALLGLAFALYGLGVYATGNTHVLWLAKQAYPEALTATFINRNMAATFLGLGLMACLGMALARVGEISSQLDFGQRLKAFGLLVLRPGKLWLLAALVCLIALVLTTSRAGFLATMAGVLAMLASLIWARPAVRVPLLAGTLGLGLLAMVIMMAAGGSLNARMASTAVGTELRPAINTLSHHTWAQTPLFGQGLGGWAAATAMVRSDEIPLQVPRIGYAHNTYWQMALELGWPAVTLMGLGLGAAVWVLLRGLRTRRRQVAWPALGLGVMVQLLVHSWPDVPFMVPAVSLAALTLLVPALMQSVPHSALKEAPAPLPLAPAARWGAGLMAVATLALSGWLVWAQTYAMQAEPVAQALRLGAKPTPNQLAQTYATLLRCRQLNPLHPTCGADATLALMTQAAYKGTRTAAGQTLLGLAVREGRMALAANPAQPILAYRLARAEALHNGAFAAGPYLAHSILAGPAEPKLAMARAMLAADILPVLSADDRALAEANLRLLWQLDPKGLWRTLKGREQGPAALQLALASLATDASFTAQWEKITGTPWGTAPQAVAR